MNNNYNQGVRDAVEYVIDELGLDIADSDILERVNQERPDIRSVFLECRQWHDKTANNTYTSAALSINGRGVGYFPLQYGDIEVLERSVALYLERVGILPPDSENLRHLSYRIRAINADYYAASEWRTKLVCWLSGEQLTAEELWAELSADYFRRVAL
jgi:hypothetical protein